MRCRCRCAFVTALLFVDYRLIVPYVILLLIALRGVLIFTLLVLLFTLFVVPLRCCSLLLFVTLLILIVLFWCCSTAFTARTLRCVAFCARYCHSGCARDYSIYRSPGVVFVGHRSGSVGLQLIWIPLITVTRYRAPRSALIGAGRAR